MQSLHVLRLLLNIAAFALALSASSRRAWSVVEPAAASRWTPPDASSDLVRLTFSPNSYCLDAFNGSSDCHAYAYLLTQSTDLSGNRNRTDATAAGLGDDLVASTTSNRLHAAASGWCVAASGGSSAGSAWLLQGAQSMFCLVVLETCVYSSVLWHLAGGVSVLSALATLLGWKSLENSAGFTTLAQAALGTLVVVEWTGYSMYMIDWGYVAVLQLVMHYGASFHLTLLSTFLALVSCRVSAAISSPFSSIHLAKLHVLPPSPLSGSTTSSNTPRRRRWSPPHAASPEVEDEDSTLDCLEQAVDPLQCSANYRT